MGNAQKISIESVTKTNWEDFEALFCAGKTCNGCWCMWWRLEGRQSQKNWGQNNKEAMKGIVESGIVPGLLAKVDGKPAGWVSIGSREDFPRFKRSKVLAQVDEKPVWSIVCFFVAKPYRKMGLTLKLMKGAIDFAKKHGAKIIEGYPNDTSFGKMTDDWAYMGIMSAFSKLDFIEVARRSPKRPIMRFYL